MAPRFPRFGRAVGRQFRVWMPTLPLMMVSARNATATHPAFAIFRTLPSATKHEIKEHLQKIYGLPVKSVKTANYEGKRKRILSRTGFHYYKYADFKKAVVTFDNSLLDVGMGTLVPELEEGYQEPMIEEELEPLGPRK